MALKNSNNRPAHSDAVRQMLGLKPKAKLPAEGLPPVTIQGIQIVILPQTPGPVRRGGGKHRVMAFCPTCGKLVSAGRLAQHEKVHG